ATPVTPPPAGRCLSARGRRDAPRPRRALDRGPLLVKRYTAMRATGLRFAPAAALLVSALLLSCRPTAPPTDPTPASPSPGLPWFEDVTAASGIDFRHYDSSTPLDAVPERMGSGLGWIDYDNDGWPDLF